jgi:hypothetical protein
MAKGHVALTLALAFALTPSALAGSAAGAPLPGGLTGTVTRGPTTPVCKVDEPCEAPAAGFVLSFQRAGAAAPVRTRTDAEGRYRVALPAGIYTVAGPARAIGRGVVPMRVHVRAGHLDRIDFSVDTGIR